MKVVQNLLAYSLTELGLLIKNKEVSPVDVAIQLLLRIDEVDPYINSYITVDHEDVLKQAKIAEEEINAGQYKGPLHGVAIGLKDLINTKNLKTTMGSEIFQNYQPEQDAFVVEKLKEAGAIIVGKQNTHQFAYGPTGDRSYYGAVRNPYDTEKMTGGSSSGSAAAVAAGLCYGSLGTDTGGSIRVPASFCGIVGMKPTYGRVSKRGVFPLSWALDHTGPLTRTVMDNAHLLNAIVGYDELDLDAVDHTVEDYTKNLHKGVKGVTIGVPSSFFLDNLHPDIKKSVDECIEVMKKLGAEIKSVDVPNMDEITEAQRILLRNDAFAVHEQRLIDFPDQWDDEVKERLYTAADSGSDYSNALQARQRAKVAFNKLFEKVDVLVTPTLPILPPKIDERYVGAENNDDQHIRWSIIKLTAPFNFTGNPGLAVPCGFSSEGMPIGVQFIGKDFSEALLYQVGYALEQELSIDTAKIEINN